VLVSEEELAIQIAQVDGVQVDDVDFAEAGQQQVLEQFAADPAGANEKDVRLEVGEGPY
jgi:hypothetical protein